MPAIDRSSGRLAASSPPRQARSSSTWIAFIGSTYGLRSRIERCTTGWRSSSSRASTIVSTASTVRRCSADERAQNRSRIDCLAARARRRTRRSRSSTWRASSRGSRRARGRTATRRRAAGARRAARRRGRTRGTPRRSRTTPGAGSGSASRRRPRGSRGAPPARPLLRPRAATRPGADLEQRELVDRREGAEEGRERGSSQTSPRYVGERDAGELVHRVARAGVRRLEPRHVGEHRQQRPRDGRLEVALGEAREAVLERDRLALLGQLEPAVDGAARLGEDAGVGRAAAPPGRAAAAVEDGQLDAAASAIRASSSCAR